MPEEKKEVKTVQVDYKCPQCETGYLRPTGQVLLCNPPKYPHRCNNERCEYKEVFRKTYPQIVYE